MKKKRGHELTELERPHTISSFQQLGKEKKKSVIKTGQMRKGGRFIEKEVSNKGKGLPRRRQGKGAKAQTQ